MARTRTLANLRSDIRYQADIEGETRRHTNAQLTRLINQSVNAFRLMISRAGHQYYFTESAAANTTAGTSDYALPSDLIELFGVDVTIDNRTISLQDFSLIERNDFQSVVFPSTGAPTMFRILGANARFLPTPDAVYSYKFLYLPTATDLSSDSDTFDGIAGWEDWVVFDVARKVLARDDDDEQMMKVESLLAKKEANILSAVRRQRATPRHRRDYQGRGERAESYAKSAWRVW